ncbi:unnamed protein product [Medioppia subpectinata]|uniref:Uncharacterized protein n=1 Tax=Medioppia subpectinata TaxID=1979941 RepID=A0A7R9Q6P5_9ACAR|nr:unnamed protein product [Medioppia subpectinata]CAG2114676.1 unnamed protein product [Medioppia subpectinata]
MSHFRELIVECEEHIPEVLRLFRDNCLNLREVYCFLEENTAQMYQQFGPLVTQIDCYELSDTVVDITSGQLLANNLKAFKFYNYYAEERQLLSAFVAHNQCLKSLDIKNINDDLNATLPELAVQLSRLTQLRRLRLALDLMNDISLTDFLRTIGVNCKQLQRLALRFYSNPLISNVKALDSLRYYCRLKRLDLILYEAFDEKVLEPLRHCKRLTHLELDLLRMTANVLKDLHQYLFIRDFYSIIDTECLSHISRLPALQMLVIGFENCGAETQDLSGNDYSDLLSRSPKLKNITINGQKSYCR